MRGKGYSVPQVRTGNGITPAYAGKSQQAQVTCESYGDHPRLCGEKEVQKTHKRPRKGSPPPMRGKARSPDIKSEVDRITPAYAGKSVQVSLQEI